MTEEELQKRIEALEADLIKSNEDKKAALGEKFKLATELKAAQKAADEAAESATNANSTELEKAIKRAEKAEKATAAADERIAGIEKNARQERGEAALSKMIANANVDASHVNMLTKALRADLKFADDGTPMLGDSSIDDFSKSYFGNKGEGHHYVRAANNSAGIVRGSDGSKPAQMTKENFNVTEYARLKASDPAAAEAIRQQLKLNY